MNALGLHFFSRNTGPRRLFAALSAFLLLFCGSTEATADITDIVITEVSNTLRLENIPDKTMGDPPFALTTITNSTGALTYTSSDPSVATTSGNIVTLQGPGKTQITVNQSETMEYPEASATTTLTVNGKSPAIITDSRFTDIVKTYGDAPFLLMAPNSSSNAPFSYSSSDTRVATIHSNIVTIIGKGTATITAIQPPSGNYTGGKVTATLTVNPATPIFSMDAISKIEGDKPFSLTLNKKSESTGLITYSSNNSSIATIHGDQVTINAPGTVIITATQAAAGNYAEGKTTTTLTIAPKLAVTWNFSTSTPTSFKSSERITSTSTANIPGKFSYSPAIAAYYKNGVASPEQTINVTFTPDSTSYPPVTKTWPIKVTQQSETFTVKNPNQTWIAPTGISHAEIDAKGGGGGGGGDDANSTVSNGSSGGQVVSIVPVIAEKPFIVIVGEGGKGGKTGTNNGGGKGGNTTATTQGLTFAGGTGGNAGEKGASGGGGGGGGASAILYHDNTPLIVAAGGGGGGGDALDTSCSFSAFPATTSNSSSIENSTGGAGESMVGDGGGGGGGGGGYPGGNGGKVTPDSTKNCHQALAYGGTNYSKWPSRVNDPLAGGAAGKGNESNGGDGIVTIYY